MARAVSQQAKPSQPPPAAEERALWIRTLLLALLAALLVKCAWVCDDAYITFRVIDNWIGGHGLRWNVAERVQAYTNPLWMLLVALPYTLTREPFYTSLALSLVLSLWSARCLAWRVASTPALGALVLLFLCASKCFVDFSTSGLENALSHALAVGTLLVYASPAAPQRRAWIVAFGASLAAINRLDSLALYAPLLAEIALVHRSRRVLANIALGCAPLVAWELVSLVYYGFLLPNTAYAKLGTALPAGELALQGLRYLENSLRNDPLTLPVIAAGLFLAFLRRDSRWTALGLGLVLQLSYVVRVGGDFMSGRFLSLPFVVALFVIASQPLSKRTLLLARVAAVAAMALVPFGPLRAPLAYQQDTPPSQHFDANGIADERAATDDVGGLWSSFRAPREGLAMHVTRGNEGAERARAEGAKLKLAPNLGYFGFHAGPGLHIVDPIGLADPLLARMPIWADGQLLARDEDNPERLPWRIGHFKRPLPQGYLRCLRDPSTRLADPALAAFKDELDLITRGPLWSSERWRLILAHLGGKRAPRPTP